jgi:hypothetical protein
MKDKQSHLERLRLQIAECEKIRDLATEPKKRELFTRLADHFKILAGEIERATVIPLGDTFLGKTFESFPSEKDV